MHDQKRVDSSDVVDEATRQRQQAAFEATGALYTSQFAKRAEHVYTKEALAENAALLQDVPEGYVMYNYRREILLALIRAAGEEDEDEAETEVVTPQARQEKARSVLLTLLKDELRLNTAILLKDFKNYFAFVHRHWVFEQLFAEAAVEVRAATVATASTGASSETVSVGLEAVPALVMVTRVLEAERRQCESLLDLDERNFHAWNHRRWVQQASRRAQALTAQVQRGQSEAEAPSHTALFTGEEADAVAYTTGRIQRNFSNYSAWHQRCLIIRGALRRHGICETTVDVDADSCHAHDQTDSEPVVAAAVWHALSELLHGDMDMLIQAVYCDPNDQSAWFYAPFILELYRTHAHDLSAATGSGDSDTHTNGGDAAARPDAMDAFVEAVVALLVEEARLGEDSDCSLPFFSLFTLLVRLWRIQSQGGADAGDAAARLTRYVCAVAASLMPSDGARCASAEQTDAVLQWLRDQLVRTDAARTGMYDHLLRKARE